MKRFCNRVLSQEQNRSPLLDGVRQSHQEVESRNWWCELWLWTGDVCPVFGSIDSSPERYSIPRAGIRRYSLVLSKTHCQQELGLVAAWRRELSFHCALRGVSSYHVWWSNNLSKYRAPLAMLYVKEAKPRNIPDHKSAWKSSPQALRSNSYEGWRDIPEKGPLMCIGKKGPFWALFVIWNMFM